MPQAQQTEQPNTAMHAAMIAAGIKVEAKRGAMYAIQAWLLHPAANAGDKRLNYMRTMLRNEVTYEIIAIAAPQALTKALATLLADAAKQIVAHQAKDRAAGNGSTGGRGQKMGVTLENTAPSAKVSQTPAGDKPTGRGAAAHGSDAPQIDASSSAALTAMANKQSAAMAIKAAVYGKLSMLDRFRINGILPLGDATPAQALGVALSLERDQIFIRMVCSNLPRDRRIREMIDGATVDRYYADAQQRAYDKAAQ